MSLIARLGPESGMLSRSTMATPRPGDAGFAGVLGKACQVPGKPCPPPGNETRVDLGTISGKNPTVSHLLVRNSDHGSKAWEIIHNPLNTGKDFKHIQPGTRVWMDAATGEIGWERPSQPAQDVPQSFVAAKNRMAPSDFPARSALSGSLSDKLVQAVSLDMGRNYNEVDCYELVVRGLSSMGVQYSGPGGIKQSLITQALAQNRPPNAYLTGEGLLSACGSRLYQRSFGVANNPRDAALEVMGQLQPLLESGSILSLSTQSRGHTGVVAAKDGAWTFINSGRMDNDQRGLAPAKGVGEEDLLAELENWFRLGKSRNESLSVTLGVLTPDKLQAFADTGSNMELA